MLIMKRGEKIMKKKLVVLGLALAMVLSFTACSSNSGNSSATSTPAGEATAAPEATAAAE